MTSKKRRKFLAETTHIKLTNLLHVCYNTSTQKDREQAYEKLRVYLASFFSHYVVATYHYDHLEELAETLQGLYLEQDDLAGYCYHIEQYINHKLKEYEQNKDHYSSLFILKRNTITEDEFLDLQYMLWTYTHGYHAGHADMYKHLKMCLQELLITK